MLELRHAFQQLDAENKYILAQGLLNPAWRLLIDSQLRQVRSEIADMVLPGNWTYENLTTFAKRFQTKHLEMLQYQEQLELIAQAQQHIDKLQQMEIQS